MRIEDEAPLTLICMTDGTAMLFPDGSAAPVRLYRGDVALTRGTERYVFADSRTTAPQVVIHPGQRCTTLSGEDPALAMTLGVRTWGNSAAGATGAVIGAYEGRSAVSARLLDLLLLDFLRTWFDLPGTAPQWWTAESDPIVGPALRLIYNDPSQPSTVANLAAAVGTSRAAFARRFTATVGRAPITFLTEWRLSLAADLLAASDATVAAVARTVGYGTPFALSTAFKRAHGLSPAAYRAQRCLTR